MRRLKRQLDVREKEFATLRIAIQSACTDLSNAVTTADDALEFKDKRPSKKGIEHCFREDDLYGAVQSGPGTDIDHHEILKKSKNNKKIKMEKIYFLIYLFFNIFNTIFKKFKILKIFETHLIFNTLFLKSPTSFIQDDIDKKNLKKQKKSNF
jgi:hypothetical protein